MKWRQRLFNLTAAASLVLTLTAVAGAVRTWSVSEEWSYAKLTRHPDGSYTVVRHSFTSAGGSVVIGRNSLHAAEDRPSVQPLSGSSYRRNAPSPAEPKFGRFQWVNNEAGSHSAWYRLFGVGLPWWTVALAASVLPAWWGVRHARARSMSKAGLCPACGYDLRATPEKCPECGTVIA